MNENNKLIFRPLNLEESTKRLKSIIQEFVKSEMCFDVVDVRLETHGSLSLNHEENSIEISLTIKERVEKSPMAVLRTILNSLRSGESRCIGNLDITPEEFKAGLDKGLECITNWQNEFGDV